MLCVSYPWGSEKQKIWNKDDLFSVIYTLKWKWMRLGLQFCNSVTMRNSSANWCNSGSPYFPHKTIIRSRSRCSTMIRGAEVSWLMELNSFMQHMWTKTLLLATVLYLPMHKATVHRMTPCELWGPADHSRTARECEWEYSHAWEIESKRSHEGLHVMSGWWFLTWCICWHVLSCI